jgi:low affinity Fe/Cu permease
MQQSTSDHNELKGSLLDTDEERSTRLTRTISKIAGSVGSFPAILLAAGLVVGWVLVGLVFFESDDRLELYDILTMVGTVTTFIMVFIIQNTQNREDRAVQTKLDSQAHALKRIMDHLGIDHAVPLSELTGLEDAPEPDIKEEQEQVRNNKPSGSKETAA